jgi:elongation factor P--(R)-beta-lysine ligase
MEGNWALGRKSDFLRRRAAMVQAIRLFFIQRDYLEVETPNRIPAPAPEAHIDAVRCGDWFLHTSPELCMKRLLAAGYGRIFQICKCFREGERGNRHLVEFTMLEWYRAGIDYTCLMEECEELLTCVFRELGYGETLSYQGRQICLQSPWERITVEDAFSSYAPLSLSEALQKDCFDEAMAVHIEPCLGNAKPTFVYDYPISFGALARAKKDNPAFSERFELYMGGMELANAFSELTDAEEQRLRFRDAKRLRLSMGKADYPQAERFLESLVSMPEAAGIALGIDRLAMIITDRTSIDDVIAFAPEDL